MADNHKTLRQMLGHGIDEEEKRYPLQTLKDNVALLTPEVLDRINHVVVQSGHNLVRKKKTKFCVDDATASWLRRTCISRRTSTCCTTRRGR